MKPATVKGYVLPLRLERGGPVTHCQRFKTAYDPQVPGLIVHRATGGASGWTVAHRESGYYLDGGFQTKDVAVAFAQELGEMGDWTLPPEELQAMPGLGVQVALLAREWREWEAEERERKRQERLERKQAEEREENGAI